MTQKTELLVELIFKKLKSYKPKEILLEKEKLRKFIVYLLKKKKLNIFRNIIKTVKTIVV